MKTENDISKNQLIESLVEALNSGMEKIPGVVKETVVEYKKRQLFDGIISSFFSLVCLIGDIKIWAFLAANSANEQLFDATSIAAIFLVCGAMAVVILVVTAVDCFGNYISPIYSLVKELTEKR